MSDESHCARCGRPNPGAPGVLPADWEVLNTRVICPGCLTREEENEILQDYMEGLDSESEEP